EALPTFRADAPGRTVRDGGASAEVLNGSKASFEFLVAFMPPLVAGPDCPGPSPSNPTVTVAFRHCCVDDTRGRRQDRVVHRALDTSDRPAPLPAGRPVAAILGRRARRYVRRAERRAGRRR